MTALIFVIGLSTLLLVAICYFRLEGPSKWRLLYMSMFIGPFEWYVHAVTHTVYLYKNQMNHSEFFFTKIYLLQQQLIRKPGMYWQGTTTYPSSYQEKSFVFISTWTQPHNMCDICHGRNQLNKMIYDFIGKYLFISLSTNKDILQWFHKDNKDVGDCFPEEKYIFTTLSLEYHVKANPHKKDFQWICFSNIQLHTVHSLATWWEGSKTINININIDKEHNFLNTYFCH